MSPTETALDGVKLTDVELRRRRARSLAIGLALGALSVLFYLVTIVKIGSNIFQRSL